MGASCDSDCELIDPDTAASMNEENQEGQVVTVGKRHGAPAACERAAKRAHSSASPSSTRTAHPSAAAAAAVPPSEQPPPPTSSDAPDTAPAATPGVSALARRPLSAPEPSASAAQTNVPRTPSPRRRSPLCATPPGEERAEGSGGGGSGRAQPATAARTGGAPGALDPCTTRSEPPRHLEERPPPRASSRVECSSAQAADPSQRAGSGPVPASASLADCTRAPLAAAAAGAVDGAHRLQPRGATTPTVPETVPAPAAEVTPEVTPSPRLSIAEQAPAAQAEHEAPGTLAATRCAGPAAAGPLAEYLRRGILQEGDELWVRYKGKEWGPVHVRGDGAIVFNSVEYLALKPLIESVCPGRGKHATSHIFHGDRCLRYIREKHGIRKGGHSAGLAVGAAVAADDDAAAPAGGSNAVEMAQTAAESAPGVGNPMATRTRQSRQRAPPPGAETAARAAVAGGASALNCQPAAAAAVNPRRGAASTSAGAARAPPSMPAAAAVARERKLTASQALSPSEREFIEQALEASLVRMADGRKPLAPVHTLHRLMQRLGAGGG